MRKFAEYFEKAAATAMNKKILANWIISELLRELGNAKIDISESKVSPENLAELVNLIEKKVINGKIAKDVFVEMFATCGKAEDIVKEKGLVLSEYPPKVAPKPYYFPVRTRIIAGLSKGVLIVSGANMNIKNNAGEVYTLAVNEINKFLAENGVYTKEVVLGEMIDPEFIEPTNDSCDNVTDDFQKFDTIDEI